MEIATPAAQIRNDGELFLHKLKLSAIRVGVRFCSRGSATADL